MIFDDISETKINERKLQWLLILTVSRQDEGLSNSG